MKKRLALVLEENTEPLKDKPGAVAVKMEY
jgi:hypothetical protein